MEARQSPRVPLDGMAILVQDREYGHASMLNLSHTGAQLSSAFSVQSGDHLSLRLCLPFQAPSPEIISAAVRWVKGSDFGVEFIQVPESEHSRLGDFLDKHPPPTDPHE